MSRLANRAAHVINAVMRYLSFGCVQYGLESSRIVEGEVSERFAVQTNTFLVEHVDEVAVFYTVCAGCSIDTCNPQAAIYALFEFTVAESILPAFFKRIFGNSINF